MDNAGKFQLLRKLLKALGLSAKAIDEIVDLIADLLGEQKAADTPEHRYHLRDDFLSNAELSFYKVLEQAIDGQWAVCPKVSLGDLFYARGEDYRSFRILTDKINRKHVDFLLCDPATMQPRGAIELDDRSHRRKDRQERDAFVDQVFESAGLPLLRVPARRTYNVHELRDLIGGRPRKPSVTAKSAHEDGGQQEAAPASAPPCPQCGQEMVLRTARSGAHAGKRFWGCQNFPKCREIIQIEASAS